jgi:DNA-binding MarR family transcriptional regulator
LFGQLRDELWSIRATWVVAADARERAGYLRSPASEFFETVVTLKPLSSSDSLELLHRRARDAQVPEGALERIARLAEGNPRRLIELARESLIEGRDLDQAAGLRAVRAKRTTSLGEAAVRLVEYLDAHGGASASDDRLLAELGWSRSRATQVLRQLENAGLVEPGIESSDFGRRKIYMLTDSLADSS